MTLTPTELSNMSTNNRLALRSLQHNKSWLRWGWRGLILGHKNLNLLFQYFDDLFEERYRASLRVQDLEAQVADLKQQLARRVTHIGAAS